MIFLYHFLGWLHDSCIMIKGTFFFSIKKSFYYCASQIFETSIDGKNQWSTGRYSPLCFVCELHIKVNKLKGKFLLQTHRTMNHPHRTYNANHDSATIQVKDCWELRSIWKNEWASFIYIISIHFINYKKIAAWYWLWKKDFYFFCYSYANWNSLSNRGC